MTTSSQKARSHSWLTVCCTLLSVAAFLLGLAGLWPTYGPSLMCVLFLIAAGPVVAFGKRANVEAVGFRAVTIMGSVACGLVASSFLNAGLLQSPQDAGAGATGGFMFLAALGMWLAIRKMQRSIPELIEGLNMKIALFCCCGGWFLRVYWSSGSGVLLCRWPGSGPMVPCEGLEDGYYRFVRLVLAGAVGGVGWVAVSGQSELVEGSIGAGT